MIGILRGMLPPRNCEHSQECVSSPLFEKIIVQYLELLTIFREREYSIYDLHGFSLVIEGRMK
jgi:hypothetical protein